MSSVNVLSLREEVICTTCLSLPRVSMYQCENGHLICKDCMSQCSSKCPTCNKHLGKIRSIIADKIISMMPLPCQHSENGCTEELYLDKLQEHEAVCRYRLICCADIACNAKVPYLKMLDHISKDHESGDFGYANGNEYKSYFIVSEDDFSKEIMWISDHLTLDDQHFFRECCRTSDGNWHVWMYLLGSEKEASSYRTTIKIVLPTSEEELIYKGKVNALNSPKRHSPHELCGLTFPDCVARKFWEKKECINYEVLIEKNPPKKTTVKQPKKTPIATSTEEATSSSNSGLVVEEAPSKDNQGSRKNKSSANGKVEGERKVKKGETKAKSRMDRSENVKESSC